MKAARALFIWKAVSGDSTATRTGAERIGTGRTGSEGTGTEPIEIEPIEIEGTGIERTGIEGIWSDGAWAIGTSRPASATIVEGLRASTANGTSKVTPAESLNLSQRNNWQLRSDVMGHERPIDDGRAMSASPPIAPGSLPCTE
jgi:hypothetical protein